MKKTLFATLLAAVIGLFGTQAMACGNGQCNGNCQQHAAGQSCGCADGTCKGK